MPLLPQLRHELHDISLGGLLFAACIKFATSEGGWGSFFRLTILQNIQSFFQIII